MKKTLSRRKTQCNRIHRYLAILRGAIAANLVRATHDVASVIAQRKARPLVMPAKPWRRSPEPPLRTEDVVFTMLADEPRLERSNGGENGLVAGLSLEHCMYR